MDNRLISHGNESHDHERGGAEKREGQARLFRRNQAIGLLLVAGAVLVWRLLHTHAGWLFPPGWWRLW